MVFRTRRTKKSSELKFSEELKMSITIYKKSTGAPKTFAHIIDAKESIANGMYTLNDPNAKPQPIVKSEVAPTVIPTVGDKKPIVGDAPIAEEKMGVLKRGRPIKITK